MNNCSLNLFSLILAFTLLSSCIYDGNKRDQLTFYNSIEEVESRIQQMNTLLGKVPASDVSNYFFDAEGNLHINNSKLGKPDRILQDSVYELSSLSWREKREFVELALFLKKNKFDGCYLNGLFGTWVYEYDRLDDNSFSNSRGVFHQNATTPIQDITQSNEILDKKGSLVLYKHRE